jgi:hypothetical protein
LGKLFDATTKVLTEHTSKPFPMVHSGAAALDDAVDELIEKVLSEGGEAFFYLLPAIPLTARRP